MSAQSTNHVLEGPSPVDSVLLEVQDLPSIPETLIEILRVLDDPDSGPSDLALVVRLDAPLMAKILRLANSPFYSSHGGLTDIHRCISVLGYKTVRQVAICISVATSLVAAVARTRGRLDYRELWRHSVVTGAVAKALARIASYPDPEEVFTAGLLHDVGKFVLEIHSPERYDQVIRRRLDEGRPLVELEREAFGFDHAALGESFARSWRFPPVLAESFGRHHVPVVGAAAQGTVPHAVALVALADYLANTMEPPRSDLGFDPRQGDPEALHGAARIAVPDLDGRLGQLRESIALATPFLDLS